MPEEVPVSASELEGVDETLDGWARGIEETWRECESWRDVLYSKEVVGDWDRRSEEHSRDEMAGGVVESEGWGFD